MWDDGSVQPLLASLDEAVRSRPVITTGHEAHRQHAKPRGACLSEGTSKWGPSKHGVPHLKDLLGMAPYPPDVSNLLWQQHLQQQHHSTRLAADREAAARAPAVCGHLENNSGQSMLPAVGGDAGRGQGSLPSMPGQSDRGRSPAPQQQGQQPMDAAGPSCLDAITANSSSAEDASMSGDAAPIDGQASGLTGSMQMWRGISSDTMLLSAGSTSMAGTMTSTQDRSVAEDERGRNRQAVPKRVRTHKKLNMQYIAKKAQYEQLKAEQSSLLLQHDLMLGMICVLEQLLRFALQGTASGGTSTAEAAGQQAAVGTPPASVRSAAAAAAATLQSALSMEHQVEQLMAEQQRLAAALPVAAGRAGTPSGGAMVTRLLQGLCEAPWPTVTAAEWPALCKQYGVEVSLLLHMLPSPSAGARAAAQLHQKHTQHLQQQLLLMLEDPLGRLHALAAATEQLESRGDSAPRHLQRKVQLSREQLEQFKQLHELHHRLQGVLLQRSLPLRQRLASTDVPAAEVEGGAGNSSHGPATGVAFGGALHLEQMQVAAEHQQTAKHLERLLHMQVTLCGAAGQQALALLSEQQCALAAVSVHPHAWDPLYLAEVAARGDLQQPAPEAQH